MQVRNAIIKEASLVKQGGALIALVRLNYGDQEQNFGGFPLNGELADVFLSDLLTVVGVDSWDKLVGKAVRAEQDDAQVYRIGNIVSDVWLNPAKTVQILAARKAEQLALPTRLLERAYEPLRCVDGIDSVLLADIQMFLNSEPADA